jgi:ribosomal protein L32E
MLHQARQHAQSHYTQADNADLFALAHAAKLSRLAASVKKTKFQWGRMREARYAGTKAGVRRPRSADSRRKICHIGENSLERGKWQTDSRTIRIFIRGTTARLP